ncbi:MAG: SPOR domain-containing protein [Bacteroidaceae bacterium]|nr:SPOR domain-containing protein [Bacteroidaceae bacterium]
MKRLFIFGTITIVTLSITSCRGNYEATKAAYEKAMEAAVERPTITADTPTDDAITEIQPMVSTSSEAKERTESVKVIDEATIQAYSVVVGSFKQLTNAKGMCERLKEDGYDAFVAQNAHGMYRVIACTFATRNEAVAARKELVNRYPSSYVGNPWLLIQQ